MTRSPKPPLQSAPPQSDADAAIEALPERYDSADPASYSRSRPLIVAAIPAVAATVPRAAETLGFLVNLVDSKAPNPNPEDLRRQIAAAVLDKAAADPEWRARLIGDPAGTLRDDPIGHDLGRIKAAFSERVCTISGTRFPIGSCIISCLLSGL